MVKPWSAAEPSTGWRALDQADRMHELDPDSAGLTPPELRKATGQSRERLMWALNLAGRDRRGRDEARREEAQALACCAGDGEQDQPPFTAPPVDLTDYSAFEGLPSSLW